jgi:hypothetical protein
MDNADNDQNEESDDLYGLFICEDYQERLFQFEELSQPVLCSGMSSTAHDLTGQIVWPACVLLSWFIHRHKALFTGKIVLELGAGCGLAGLVASNYSDHTYITDGNDVVLRLLHRNKAHLKRDNITISKLMWGATGDIDNLFPAEYSSVVYPDVIIGADVILWPNQVFSLLYTIRSLLLLRGGSTTTTRSHLPSCYISYIVRATSTTELLYATALTVGLSIDPLDVDSFLPTNCRDFDSLQKQLLRITVDDTVVMDDIHNSVAFRESMRNMVTSALPC